MAVLGGLVVDPDLTYSEEDWDIATPDPWPQGMRIFDLTSFEWKTSYDAAAAPYTTPKNVTDFIEERAFQTPEWSSPVVESWFMSTKERR